MIGEGRCATCRHWRLREIHQYWDGSASDDAGWGACALTRSDGGDPPETPTLAWAIDYEGYWAELVTHETFGCVQWATRDADSANESSR